MEKNLGKEFRTFSKDHKVTSSFFDDFERKVLIPQMGFNDPSNMTQYVIEERPGNFRAIDVFTRLISERIIFMGMEFTQEISNLLVAQLLFLDNIDPKNDITMYINSPGGSVYAGLSIIDTVDFIRPDVSTVCTGIAASMGAVLLSKGKKGKRFALPHSRVMIHQVSAGMQGTSKDMEISLKQTLELKKDLYEILAKACDKDYDTIEKDCDRDYWLRAADAKEYGLIDEVVLSKKQ